MPVFSNEPPQDPRGRSLELRRVSANRPMTAFVTSPDLVGCPTHYFKGKTCPHEQENCEACENGLRWLWHSYLSAWDPANRVHFLLESTARATEFFTQYRKAYDTLRGCYFRASRPSFKPNGKVFIECKRADLAKVTIPDPPDLLKVLGIIWNIPEADLSVSGTNKETPALQTASAARALRQFDPDPTRKIRETIQQHPA